MWAGNHEGTMKSLRIAALINLAGLFLAALILIAVLTEAAMIQIIFIQPLYWALDHSWMLGRAIINVLIALAASVVTLASIPLSTKADKRIPPDNPLQSWVIIPFVALGLLLSSVIYYCYKCCDTPWNLHLGFPLSWGGIPVDGILQAASRAGFLLQHVMEGKWFINGWGLIADLLFWFNIASLLCFIRSTGLLARPRQTGNFPNPNSSIEH